MHKAGAKFDPEKNKWFNQHYLKLQNTDSLTSDYQLILNEKGIEATDEYVSQVVELIKERATFVSDFFELSDFFFQAPNHYDEKALKNWKEDTAGYMEKVADILSNTSALTSSEIETAIKGWITAEGIGMGKVMQPLRLCMVGALKGPDLFQIIELIGKEEAITRIKKAIESNK